MTGPSLRHREYEIYPSAKNAPRTLEVNGKTVRLGKHGYKTTDARLAADIDQKYGAKAKGADGMQMVVIPTDNNHLHNGEGHSHIHTYTFRFAGVPWAKYDELGRRLPDDAAVSRKGK